MGDMTMELELSHAKMPYPGLRAFREDESEIFFGREQQTNELLARLERHHFIAVTGPSGCGKSSLVKAGMIPALLSGFMQSAGSRWRVCQMHPGQSPLLALAMALAVPQIVGDQHDSAASPSYVEAALRFGPLGLLQVLRESPVLENTSVLVLVDQFEEIFRYRERINRDEADAFVRLLLETARQNDPKLKVFVVITMRSDYLGDCTVFHGLPEAINDGQYLTPRLTREECSQAIRGPARVFDGDVEDGLLNALLNDFGTDPDQLPLLQHALMRMWAQKARGSDAVILNRDDYTHRLGEALDIHANEVLNGLSLEQQQLAEIMFRRLTERSRGRRDTRAPAFLDDIAAIAGVEERAIKPVVEAFRQEGCNFVVASTASDEQRILLDIGHESLIRQWKTLSQWVNKEAESAAIYHRLADAARRYKLPNPEAELIWGRELDIALSWKKEQKPNPAWAERYQTPEEIATHSTEGFHQAIAFLEESQRQADKEAAEERHLAELEQQRRIDEARREAEASEANAKANEAKAKEELAMAENLALRKSARLYFAITLVAMTAFGIGVVAYNKNTEIRDLLAANQQTTGTFASVVYIRGIPKGVGPELTPDQVKRRAVSYEITTLGRGDKARVIKMRAINARGEPTDKHSLFNFLAGEGTEDTTNSPKASKWDYIYDQDRRVAYEIEQDRKGRNVRSMVYMPISQADGENRRLRQVLGPDGFSLPQRSCAGIEVVEFDDRGREWRFSYVDRFGNPVPGRDGASVQEHVYNDQDFETEFISKDLKGAQRINDRAGNASQSMSNFNLFGRPERYEFHDAGGGLVEIDGVAINLMSYDDAGNIVDIRNLNRLQQATINKEGWHRQTYVYGLYGRVERTSYWEADGSPTTDKNYCHQYWYAYDDKGQFKEQPSEVRCIGTDGKPSPGRSGAPRVTIDYDTDGNLIAWSNFGGPDLNEPVLIKDGWHRLERRYDKRGNVELALFLDRSGKPTNLASGYASYQSEFKNDKEISRRYFGTDDRPTRIADGYSEIHWEYDDKGNVMRERYYTDGKSTLHKDGYFGVDFSRDSCGRVTQRWYIGANNKPLPIAQGYAGEKRNYDTLGRETGIAFLSTTGDPALSSDGIAGWDDILDRFGNVLERRYRGVKGERTLDSSGAAGWQQRFDSHGRVIEEASIDLSGKLVSTKGEAGGRYAAIKREFDGHGNLVQESYFGQRGEAVNLNSGYAMVKFGYDATGKKVSTAHFGRNGEPVLDQRGAHLVRYRNNPQGHMISESYYGLRSEPVLIVGGFHRIELDVDTLGRELKRRHFGLDDKLASGSDGWHEARRRYDQWGRVIAESFFSTNGQPTIKNEGSPFHLEKKHYDHRGNLTEQRFYDANNKPTRGLANATIVRYTFDDRSRMIGKSDADERGPMKISAVYASEKYRYDDRGRQVRRDYFGPDNKPINTKEGHAHESITYGLQQRSELYWRAESSPDQAATKVIFDMDARGNETGRTYYVRSMQENGPIDQLINTGNKLKWARAERHYDERGRGRVTKVTYYQASDDKPPKLNILGSVLNTYDAFGRLEDQSHVNKDGELYETENAVSRTHWRYDKHGFPSEERFYDASNQPVGENWGPAVIVRYSYNIQGKEILRRFFDANDQLVLNDTKEYGRCAGVRTIYGAKGATTQCLDTNLKPKAP